MRVKVSALALYNYDSHVFDDFSIPAGLDKPTLLDMLLTESADLCVIYPDADLFKRIVKSWSARKLPVWTKLYSTTLLEYNPIENYDRTENRTASIIHTGTIANSGNTENTGTQGINENTVNSGTVKNTGTDTGTVGTAGFSQNTENDTGTITDAKTGYNSVTFQDTDKRTNNLENVSSNSNNQTETRNLAIENTREDNLAQNTSTTRTDNLSESRTDTETRNLADTHTEYLKVNGNIGIRSSQELIQQEREVDLFDIYSVIIDDFIDYFCIGIY